MSYHLDMLYISSESVGNRLFSGLGFLHVIHYMFCLMQPSVHCLGFSLQKGSCCMCNSAMHVLKCMGNVWP